MATCIGSLPPTVPSRRPHSEQPSLAKVAAVAASAFALIASYNKWGFWGATLVTLGCVSLLYKLFQQKDSDGNGAPRGPCNTNPWHTQATSYTSQPGSDAYPTQRGWSSSSSSWPADSNGAARGPLNANTSNAQTSYTSPPRSTVYQTQPGCSHPSSSRRTTDPYFPDYPSRSGYPPVQPVDARSFNRPHVQVGSRADRINETQTRSTIRDGNGELHVVPGSRGKPDEEKSPTARGADGASHVVPGSRNR